MVHEWIRLNEHYGTLFVPLQEQTILVRIKCFGGDGMIRVYIPNDAERYGNYYRAIEAAGGQICFGGNPAECAALLLPGGGDLEPWRYGQDNIASFGLEPARDAAELDLLDVFTTLKKPILGICRGLQVINVFFGGTLVQDIPGHSAASGVDRLHHIHTARSPLRIFCAERDIVNSAHHQAADRLGSRLQAVQWTPDGTVEALCHRCLPIWAVQWHPERLCTPLGHSLFRAFLAYC